MGIEKRAQSTGVAKNHISIFSLLLLVGILILVCHGCIQKAATAFPAATPFPTNGTDTASPGAGSSPSCNVSEISRFSESPRYAALFAATELLTKPEDRSITVNVVPKNAGNILVQYGSSSGSWSCETPAVAGSAGSPISIAITGLSPDTLYYYHTCSAKPGTSDLVCGPEHTFQTQRHEGSTFMFGVQADSHPEREKTMFSGDLYRQTMQNVATDRPDFYISLGDDFSIDPLIDRNQISAGSVNAIYLNQRTYLETIGSSSPVFLVNGNHEQAARYLLDGTATSPAILAGTARMQYFPQPVPDAFYTGDPEPVEYLGLPGDYYAWTWGDALFVVIDPYWHSSIAVDNSAGKNSHQKKNSWDITLGDTPYDWLEKILANNVAKYKFVFTHHVLGTGRGGIEEAGLYEWGGWNQKGIDEFATMRPGWELPIQQLMAKNNVTIFFQGHDHLFVRQELDGVTYQEVPLPADPTYSLFNADAYRSGTKLPNTGYLRVTVSRQNTTVEYEKTYLPGKETASEKNGMVAYAYTISGGKSAGGTA